MGFSVPTPAFIVFTLAYMTSGVPPPVDAPHANHHPQCPVQEAPVSVFRAGGTEEQMQRSGMYRPRSHLFVGWVHRIPRPRLPRSTCTGIFQTIPHRHSNISCPGCQRPKKWSSLLLRVESMRSQKSCSVGTALFLNNALRLILLFTDMAIVFYGGPMRGKFYCFITFMVSLAFILILNWPTALSL